MTRFWMVCRKPQKGEGWKWGSPKWRHYARPAAVAEARRLADKMDVSFAVLGVEEVIAPGGGTEPLEDGEEAQTDG